MKRNIHSIMNVHIILLYLPLMQCFQPNRSKLYLPKNKIHELPKSAQINRNVKIFSKKDDESDSDERTGMNDAFKSLDALSSLDFGDIKEEDPKSKTTDLIADKDLLKNVKTEPSDDKDEVKLYTEIVKEMENEGEDGIYDNIMGELKDSPSSSSSSAKNVLSDADGIGSVLGRDENEETLTVTEITQNTDEFMKRALEEAMDEVNSDKDAKLPEGILDDAEMMKEINAIFDRANEKILDSVAEMKAEQVR